MYSEAPHLQSTLTTSVSVIRAEWYATFVCRAPLQRLIKVQSSTKHGKASHSKGSMLNFIELQVSIVESANSCPVIVTILCFTPYFYHTFSTQWTVTTTYDMLDILLHLLLMFPDTYACYVHRVFSIHHLFYKKCRPQCLLLR